MAKKKSSSTSTAIANKAKKAGTPFSFNPTKVRAANTTMIPWAKLNTPDALKINTKPKAINE